MTDPTPRADVTAAISRIRLESDRTLTSLGYIALMLPTLWFIRTDFLVAAGDWTKLRQRLALRAVLLATSNAGVVVMRAVRTRHSYANAVWWLSLSTALVTLWINSTRAEGSGLPLRSPMLILSVMYFAMPNTVWRQCVPPLVMSAGLLALRLTFLHGGGIDVPGDVVALASLNVIGVLAVLRRQRLEDATNDVVSELRNLRDIIPICSHCRKLRTDVGDWHQLEEYFRLRGDAAFSHGICPDCLAKHYEPELEGR